MTESVEGFGEAGHVKSIYPEDYARFTHRQPDSDQPIERFDLDTTTPGHHLNDVLPAVANPNTGEVESPPRYYTPFPTNAENQPGERIYRYTVGNHTQRLWWSPRHGMVIRWGTEVGSPYSIDLEWMSEAGPLGRGQSFGGSERWQEYRGTSAESHHNPTEAGAAPVPFDTNPLPAQELIACPSQVIYQNVTSTKLEAAQVPLEFLDGETANDAWHNTDSTHVAMFWRQKQFQRIEPCFMGDPFITRVTRFYYNPREWFGPASFLDPAYEITATFPTLFNVGIAAGLCLMDENGFDLGYYADLKNDTTASPIASAFDGVTFTPTPLQVFQTRQHVAFYFDNAGNFQQRDTLFPSGYGVMANVRSSDAFTVGVACYLELPSDSFFPTVCSLQNSNSGARIHGVPTPHHSHAGGRIITVTSDNGVHRPAGWLGWSLLVYAGPGGEMMTRLPRYADYLSEELDAYAIIPPSVREGTELAETRTRISPRRTPSTAPINYPSGVTFP